MVSEMSSRLPMVFRQFSAGSVWILAFLSGALPCAAYEHCSLAVAAFTACSRSIGRLGNAWLIAYTQKPLTELLHSVRGEYIQLIRGATLIYGDAVHSVGYHHIPGN